MRVSTGRPGASEEALSVVGAAGSGVGGLCLGWKGAQRPAWGLWAGLTWPRMHFLWGNAVSVGPKVQGAGSTLTGCVHCAQLPTSRPPPALHRGPQPPPPAGSVIILGCNLRSCPLKFH